MTKPRLESLTTTVTKMLAKEGIDPTTSHDPPALGFGVSGDAGEWACFVRVDEEREMVAFYSLCPLSADARHMAAMHELVTRANWDLAVGNVDLDLDDGEIRIRTSMDFEGTKATGAMLQRLLYANLAAMDLLLPAIAAVLQGASARDALAAVETERVP